MGRHAEDVFKFVQSRVDDGYYTPDTPALFRSNWHPLFVYGSLKRGFSRHSYLEDCPLVGTGFTRNTGWCMYRTEGDKPFPVMFSAVKETPGAVYGEIYLVSAKTIRLLDFLENNGTLYHRMLRTVDINNPAPDTPKTRAVWMYVAQRSTFARNIEQGLLKECEAVDDKNNKNKKFYVFKKSYDAPMRNM